MGYIDSLVESFQKDLDSGRPIEELFDQFNQDTTGELVPVDEAEYNKTDLKY